MKTCVILLIATALLAEVLQEAKAQQTFRRTTSGGRRGRRPRGPRGPPPTIFGCNTTDVQACFNLTINLESEELQALIQPAVEKCCNATASATIPSGGRPRGQQRGKRHAQRGGRRGRRGDRRGPPLGCGLLPPGPGTPTFAALLHMDPREVQICIHQEIGTLDEAGSNILPDGVKNLIDLLEGDDATKEAIKGWVDTCAAEDATVSAFRECVVTEASTKCSTPFTCSTDETPEDG